MKGAVIIPKSDLSMSIEETQKLQRQAVELLRELEEMYKGHKIGKVGEWRQDPTKWKKIKP